MSNQTNLGSLFKGKKATSNSALKYERPSDPAAEARARSGSQQPASPAPAAAAAAPGAPNYAFTGKTSGLYKLDKATNQYAGVPGATPPLGIAIVGTGHQYGLFIYNGQNQRFVTTPISPAFKVDFQGAQYVNFYDAQGAMWSVAFATAEDAVSFATGSALVRIHAEYHTNRSQTTPFLLKISSAGAQNEPLRGSDKVGVQYRMWTNTRDDPNSLPQHAISGTPHRAVIGGDIEKLVVGSSR